MDHKFDFGNSFYCLQRIKHSLYIFTTMSPRISALCRMVLHHGDFLVHCSSRCFCRGSQRLKVRPSSPSSWIKFGPIPNSGILYTPPPNCTVKAPQAGAKTRGPHRQTENQPNRHKSNRFTLRNHESDSTLMPVEDAGPHEAGFSKLGPVVGGLLGIGYLFLFFFDRYAYPQI